MNAPVVFDGSVLVAGPVTGVGRAFVHALRAWRTLSDLPAVVLVPGGVPPEPLEGFDVRDGPRGFLGREWRLPRRLAGLGARLLHSPVAAVPGRAPCPVVATVHDLPWLHPGLRGEPGARYRHRRAVRVARHRAAAVIVPSRATAADLERATPRGTAPIHVVPHGIPLPAEPAPPAPPDAPFLVLGDDRPRKNHGRLRAAWERARTTVPGLPPLRFVGPPAAWLPEPEKTAVLRRSRALLQPALLEGFGLPVLEAMAHGVPVLAGTTGSLPEVAGDAALLADPRDVDALAAAMVRLHRDDDLRRELQARGRARAAGYPATATAAGWCRIHDAVTCGPPAPAGAGSR